jgi:hypothetical protein
VRQCVLRKGNLEKIAWIPARFAVQGKFLRLLDDDGWQVELVGTYQESVETPHGYFAGGIFHES